VANKIGLKEAKILAQSDSGAISAQTDQVVGYGAVAFWLEQKKNLAGINQEEKEALVICIIDASKVERGLYLALEIIEKGYPVVIALNMWDMAKRTNVKVDTKKLEQILGVPVVPTVATRGEGFKELVSRMREAAPVAIEEIARSVGGSIGTHR